MIMLSLPTRCPVLEKKKIEELFSMRPIDLHPYTSFSKNGAMNINFGRRLIAYPNNALRF